MSIFNKLLDDFNRLEMLLDDIKYYLGSIHEKRFISISKKERDYFLNKLEFRCIFILSKIREIREESKMLEDNTHSQ